MNHDQAWAAALPGAQVGCGAEFTNSNVKQAGRAEKPSRSAAALSRTQAWEATAHSAASTVPNSAEEEDADKVYGVQVLKSLMMKLDEAGRD